MNRAFDILGTVLPVFLTLGLGMLCRRRRIISPEGVETLKKVVVNITLPAVNLAAFSAANYTPRTLLIPLWVFTCCCIALALGFTARRALRFSGKLTPYFCTCFEGGMLGFALYPMFYGTLAPFAIVDMGQVIFVFTIYKALLSGARGPRALLREAASSPSLWTLVIGTIIGASGLYGAMASSGINVVFDKILDFVSAPTAFMILLSVGYELKPAEIPWRETAAAVAARLGIMGLLLGLTLLFNRFVLGGIMDNTAAILLFSLPAPFVLPVFAKNDPEERSFLSSSLSVMTCVTVLLFTIMVIFIR